MIKLEGVIEKITFQSGENGFTVARVKVERESITVVGRLPGVSAGENLKLMGRWEIHPTYGRQFMVEEYETLPPVTAEGIERYLGSGLIKGIGPVTAGKIVAAFGVSALKVIEETPEKLREVEGIGPQKAEKIARAVEEQRNIRRVMIFLRGVGITPALANKIYKRYGESSIEVLQQNPYCLAEEVYGIGFKTADRIAGLLGRNDPAAPERVRAGILFLLGKNSDEGHVYAPADEFIGRASAELQVPPEIIKREIAGLSREKEVYQEGNLLYLAAFYRSECGAAEKLASLLRSFQGKATPPPTAEVRGVGDHQAALAPEQCRAVELARREGVLIITGGPGTGKTTTVRSIIREFQAAGLRVTLAAPTGRAAKRLAEATGHEAKTIHRLLEFGYSGAGFRYGRDEEHPLESDVIIIDEVSMVDLILFYHLLKAIPPGTRLILVGDQDQLPSVGPGSVLKDLISSGVVPVVTLKTVFRQARESHIVTNAHRINRGIMPETKGTKDFFFIEAGEPEKIVDEILRLITVRLPRYLKCDPVDEIQVLSPMRRTVTGVDNLNFLLQKVLNPEASSKPEIQSGGRIFRLGDKVMQLRNNYQKMVFNGDMGRITKLDPEDQQLEVTFTDGDETRKVVYDFDELDELVLSYAVSVHKSQGSEYPVVIMPVTTQHYLLLQRNLFYTAVTRAKKMVVLIGLKKAMAIAVKNDRIEQRYSRLGEILKKIMVTSTLSFIL